MRLSDGMYWIGMKGCRTGNKADYGFVVQYVGFSPFATRARDVEGCGLLADGQACQSINHSEIRLDCLRAFQALPVDGSLHRRR